MGFAEEFNTLDFNKFLILFGTLLIVAGIGAAALTPGGTALGVEITVAGLGLITLGKAGANSKKMDTVNDTLKQVTVCCKPDTEPACKYESKIEVKV